MADKQISELTSASNLTDSTLFVVEQGGSAMKANWSLMKNHINPGVAPLYSSSSTYAVGDYVLYQDTLYRCVTPITTAESWTAAHWTAVVLGDDIDMIRDAVSVSGNYEHISASYTSGAYIAIETKAFITSAGSNFRLFGPISVSEGEVYKITCAGYGNAAAYAFGSDENTITDVFPAQKGSNSQHHVYIDEFVTIPAGVTVLYIERNTQSAPSISASIDKLTAPDFVKYNAQALTDLQKATARSNIGAANADVETKATIVGDGCDTTLSVELETGSGNRVIGETFTPTTSTTYRRKRFIPKPGVMYKIGTKSEYAVAENDHILALDANDVILATYGRYADVSGVLNETYVTFDNTVASVVVIVRATHNRIYLTECASVSAVYEDPVIARLPIARYNDESSPKVATWLWFTDIHGDATTAKAISDFYVNFNATPIVDILNGGDTVLDTGADDISEVMATKCANALNVIGNHDSSTKVDNVRDWDGLSAAECYTKFMAPYKDNWGTVTFGGADLCYYYKDYSSLALRLIALDQSHWDATQKTWLQTTLASAQTAGYSVMVLSHYLPESITGIPCNMDSYASPDATYDYYTLGGGDAGAVIQSWIAGGGKFVIWLCGHSHRDRFGLCSTSDDVTVRQLTKASPDRTHYEYREGKYRNAFELVTLDLNNGLVKFQRIGCNTDMWLTQKNALVYDFVNHKIVTQF